MRRLVIFIVVLALCLLLAIWAPWTSLKINFGGIFGIKQASEVAGLQVYSLSGNIVVYIDNSKMGTVIGGINPYVNDNVVPGEHLITLKRENYVENTAYWEFSKVVTFYKATTVVASFNLGPDEEFSEGHVIYATESSNPSQLTDLTVTSNVEGATLTVDNNPMEDFEKNSITTSLNLNQQHTILIHKAGYEDLQFTILPATQEDRNKLKGLNLNIDAHLMLQPVKLETK